MPGSGRWEWPSSAGPSAAAPPQWPRPNALPWPSDWTTLPVHHEKEMTDWTVGKPSRLVAPELFLCIVYYSVNMTSAPSCSTLQSLHWLPCQRRANPVELWHNRTCFWDLDLPLDLVQRQRHQISNERLGCITRPQGSFVFGFVVVFVFLLLSCLFL